MPFLRVKWEIHLKISFSNLKTPNPVISLSSLYWPHPHSQFSWWSSRWFTVILVPKDLSLDSLQSNTQVNHWKLSKLCLVYCAIWTFKRRFGLIGDDLRGNNPRSFIYTSWSSIWHIYCIYFVIVKILWFEMNYTVGTFFEALLDGGSNPNWRLFRCIDSKFYICFVIWLIV